MSYPALLIDKSPHRLVPRPSALNVWASSALADPHPLFFLNVDCLTWPPVVLHAASCGPVKGDRPFHVGLGCHTQCEAGVRKNGQRQEDKSPGMVLHEAPQ